MQVNDEEILRGRGMRIRRNDSSAEELARRHVEGAKRANGGPPPQHPMQRALDGERPGRRIIPPYRPPGR
jgi:hypothetical protein